MAPQSSAGGTGRGGLPLRRDRHAGGVHGGADRAFPGPPHPARVIDRRQRRIQQLMHQGAELQRVQLQGLGPGIRLAPVQGIAPGEAQRVAQQHPERGGGMQPVQRAEQRRMIGSHQPVMGGEGSVVPVRPAGGGGGGPGGGRELGGPGHQAVLLAHRVLRDACPAQPLRHAGH